MKKLLLKSSEKLIRTVETNKSLYFKENEMTSLTLLTKKEKLSLKLNNSEKEDFCLELLKVANRLTEIDKTDKFLIKTVIHSRKMEIMDCFIVIYDKCLRNEFDLKYGISEYESIYDKSYPFLSETSILSTDTLKKIKEMSICIENGIGLVFLSKDQIKMMLNFNIIKKSSNKFKRLIQPKYQFTHFTLEIYQSSESKKYFMVLGMNLIIEAKKY